MIVGGKDKETGFYVFRVYDQNNSLFATIESEDRSAAENKANEVQREALASLILGSKDHDLDMSNLCDDELLAALHA